MTDQVICTIDPDDAKDYDDAISIANDTLFGLGAGVWSRDGNVAYRAGRDIKAGRVVVELPGEILGDDPTAA